MSYLDLPAIADSVEEWFPELTGRAFAALGDSITKENMPQLPLAIVLAGAVSVDKHQYRQGVSGPVDAADELQIEFWLDPQRYKRKDGTESPFWSYYDYHPLMRRLTAKLAELGQENKVFFEFCGVEIAPDELALIFAFKFRQHYRFCPAADEAAQAAVPLRIKTSICEE